MNRLGDDGAQALAVALKSNTTLTKLDLRGSCRLPASLRCASDENIALLADNRIGNDGATALAGALSVNKSLVNIGLEGKKTPHVARQAPSWTPAQNIRSFFSQTIESASTASKPWPQCSQATSR